MQAVEDRVRGDLKSAEEDNVKVYMEIIPDNGNLPTIQPYLLVKAKLPDYLSPGTETWFSSIVPDKAAKSLSRCAPFFSPCQHLICFCSTGDSSLTRPPRAYSGAYLPSGCALPSAATALGMAPE